MTGPVNRQQACAGRWHDTDHGKDRAPPRRSYGRKARQEPEPEFLSSCWCCCDLCDPDGNPDRPNPYWSRAHTEMRGT